MRYYATVLSDPNHPSYGLVLGVFRFEPASPERYDRETKQWVDFPEMVAGISGLGGESDYMPVSREVVEAAIAAWEAGRMPPTLLSL